jgi:SagB-type dehydrogenase family enzyme
MIEKGSLIRRSFCYIYAEAFMAIFLFSTGGVFMRSLAKEAGLAAAIVILGLIFIILVSSSGLTVPPNPLLETVELPEPVLDGQMSVREGIDGAGASHAFNSESINMSEVSNLLWAARRVFPDGSGNTGPSGENGLGLSAYLVVSRVHDVARGIYRYVPSKRILIPVGGSLEAGLFRKEASEIRAIQDAPVLIIITGNTKEVINHMFLNAGRAVQNVQLQAHSMGLGSLSVAEFNMELVTEALGLEDNESPVAIIGAGLED